MIIKEFFDKDTFTLTYVVYDKESRDAIVIDPVLDLEVESGTIKSISLQQLTGFIEENNLNPVLSLETHAHADHLSGAQALQAKYPDMKIAISERITAVQDIFIPAFAIDSQADGHQFDRLLIDDEHIRVGNLVVKVIPTPGHTPACTSFLINDAVFTGDALFMPDFGTGRCDFPGGSARELYESVHGRLYSLPDETKVYVGHDYQPGGRDLKFETTIGESKRHNIHIRENTEVNEYVHFRNNRDQTLKAPRLLLPSIQVNVMGGRLPEPDATGRRYLKLPLKVLGE